MKNKIPLYAIGIVLKNLCDPSVTGNPYGNRSTAFKKIVEEKYKNVSRFTVFRAA